MKTVKSNKLTKALCSTVILLVSTSLVFAYPPDNAAVLYYKASLICPDDEAMHEMLSELCNGRMKLNGTIKKFVKKNQRLINIVLDASEMEYCDWGFDYSQGCDILLAPFGRLRRLIRMIATDARILAQQGDYKTALDRCISVHKVARHLNDRLVLSYLVGISTNAVANDCIIEILSDMPQDMEMLTWLKNQLVEIDDNQPFSIKPVLCWKREAGIISMFPDRISDLVNSSFDEGECKEKILEKIRTADGQFFTRNRDYWNNYMDAIEAAFESPYPQAHQKLKKLEPCEELNKNHDATLTFAIAPSWHKICALSTRLETHSNAIKAAIEIYMIKAKTGKLPDALPAGLPVDLFSDKDFEYEKTADGFILRCQGKDLGRDEIYEYEFKVKN